jgi:hypothetical protein
LNDGRIQNPSNAFGVVPLSNFVPRGFGFVDQSIAILDHEVPNPNLTIRDFSIAAHLLLRAMSRVAVVAVLRGAVRRRQLIRRPLQTHTHTHTHTHTQREVYSDQ